MNFWVWIAAFILTDLIMLTIILEHTQTIKKVYVPETVAFQSYGASEF